MRSGVVMIWVERGSPLMLARTRVCLSRRGRRSWQKWWGYLSVYCIPISSIQSGRDKTCARIWRELAGSRTYTLWETVHTGVKCIPTVLRRTVRCHTRLPRSRIRLCAARVPDASLSLTISSTASRLLLLLIFPLRLSILAVLYSTYHYFYSIFFFFRFVLAFLHILFYPHPTSMHIFILLY